MKKSLMVAVISMMILCVLISWSWAEGEDTSQPAVVSAEKEDAGPVKPSLTWGDYKYTFNAVEPSSDIDPQSVIMHWETPSPYNIDWNAANYLHFWIHIEWPENLRPWDYMPLQLIVHTPGSPYHQFGKDCSNSSFLWRRHARYPNIVGNSTDVIFTMDTQGAPISPDTGYLTVNGVLEVWDWRLPSRRNLVTYHQEEGFFVAWQRSGSTYNSITHLADIPLWEIIEGVPGN